MKSRRTLAIGLVASTLHLGCSGPEPTIATASADAQSAAPAAPAKSKGGRKSKSPKPAFGAPGSAKAEAKPSLLIRDDL